LAVVRRARPDFLMAAGEHHLTALNARREEFERHTRLLFAPQAILDQAFDKARTLALAAALGLPVPESYPVATPADVVHVAAHAAYPVVLKLPRSYEDSRHAHLNFHYRYVFSAGELIAFLRPNANAPYYPLVQRFYPGHGIGVETCFYRDTPLAVFQHRRLREYPLTGGASVYRRSELADPQLAEWSLRLLRAMRWDGVAMVEFRADPRSGSIALMEVNGRFWGSLPLAVHAGVNFPYLLYQAHTQPVPATVPRYKAHVHCRQLSADTKWLVELLGRPRGRGGVPLPCGRLSAVAQYLYAFVRCWHYDIEWPDDPRPALAFWRRKLSGADRPAEAASAGPPPAARAPIPAKAVEYIKPL
jgi:predicted ATP-grasp superfamily ATP-dependent carboligase